jgi:hypothetical protein
MHKFTPILALLIFTACSKKDSDIDHNNDLNIFCKVKSIVSYDLFANAPDDFLIINKVTIEEDCMTINFGSSGCSGDSWKISLLGAENIIDTGTPKREIRLSLQNPEFCEAWITKEYTFDISSFRIDTSTMILFLTNNGMDYIYKY